VIIYHESKLDKNAIYEEFAALLAMRKLMLVDNKRLQQQCIGLERRTRTGGKDVIDHGSGGHDDLINRAAGACQLIFQEEIATRITKSEMQARMPSMQSSNIKRHSDKRLAAAEEMEQIMLDSGCNKIVRKKIF